MEIKERKDLDPAFLWDLSSLYENDAAFEKDLISAEDLVKALKDKQGHLKNAKEIADYYEAMTAMCRRFNNLITYASLRMSEDTRDEKANSLYSRAVSKYTDASMRVSFAEPEILSLPEEDLKRIAADPQMASYRFLFEELIKNKPHVLSAESEVILSGFGEVLRAPKEIADALMDADLSFDAALDSKGEAHEVTESNFFLLQQEEDRTLRKNVFKSYYKGFASHNNTFAKTYAGIVKSSSALAKARHFDSSRAMSMDEENIPLSVYDSLIATVRKHLPAMHRYLALRKKMLNLDELHYYDVYVPLTGANEHRYSYEDAKKLVLRAVSPLGEDYVSTVERAFTDRWIDVYPNRGKRGGAFSSGTYDSNPFILMSYAGDYESLSTVAHEMGHSMHTFLANRTQPVQYADYTLFVAEVASTVNENLLVESLLGEAKDPKDRMFLLNQYLEGFRGTVFRQTMFAEFEKEAHAMEENGEALTKAALNGLYKKLVEDYFGPILTMDEEVQYEWSRIPHFYRPFYVYKYATSYSASVALSEKILSEGEAAVKPYLEFLSMGGSRYPLEELQHGGVDLTTPAPVDAALCKFERILEEAEKCASLL